MRLASRLRALSTAGSLNHLYNLLLRATVSNLFLFLILSGVGLELLLVLLSSGDGGGVMSHLWVHSTKTIRMIDLYSVRLDGGYYEHYQYLLLFWSFELSLILVLARKLFRLIWIPLIWLFLLFDDLFSLHDWVVGRYIHSIYLDLAPTQPVIAFLSSLVRIKDLAEISYWSVFLLSILVLIILSSRKASFQVQSFMRTNIQLWSFLAFFAILVDLIGANLEKLVDVYSGFGSILDIFVGAFEEVGEMVVIASSVILFYKLSVVSLPRPIDD